MESERIPLLLVDDDEDDHIIVRDLLNEIPNNQFALDWSSNYGEALEVIRSGKHLVYLLDYRLGEHTGLDLLNEALSQGCQAPMILLTGRGDNEVDAEALRMGAADYLIKGQFDASLLERSIRYAMKHKSVENELRKVVAELKRSNRDLEQFAYVASHDMKEPLNMVVSYLQLLEKRYHGTLGQEADEFIEYAVQNAMRMQNLVSDLLRYSRLGAGDKPFESVDCGEALKLAIQNLRLPITESGAEVTSDNLPTVQGEKGQIVQLFQNLLSNAIKFRCEGTPRVHVGARN